MTQQPIITALFISSALFISACNSSSGGSDNGSESSSGSGSGSSTPTSAPASPTNAELSVDAVKTLAISWDDTTDATYYKIMENPDGISGFSQVGGDIDPGQQLAEFPVPLFDRLNAQYLIDACNSAGCTSSSTLGVSGSLNDAIGYFKASNTDSEDYFGWAVSLSGDGLTLAVGARYKDASAGAVYVFQNNNGNWSQTAYIQADNAQAGDAFGDSISLSHDGNTLAVGALAEDSSTMGVGSTPDEDADNAGAVYIFSQSNKTWSQQAYIKASNTHQGDWFGGSVSLSDDGNTLAVGAPYEESSTSGINSTRVNDASNYSQSGAAHIYTRSGTTWAHQAYIKASDTSKSAQFGAAVSLNSDGNTLAVGAHVEDSTETDSGAVYVYTRAGSTWSEEAQIKASNVSEDDYFGLAISISDDGNTLAIAARYEDGNATTIDGADSDDAVSSGAVYVYTRSVGAWSQESYIKSSNSEASDELGSALSISGDGNTLVVGAIGESSDSTGIDGANNNNASDSGAAYIYKRSAGIWSETNFIKASNTDSGDQFGTAVAISSDGTTVAIGAAYEDGDVIGIDGDQTNEEASDAGAVYLY